MSTILLMLSLVSATMSSSLFEAPWRWTTERGQEVTLGKWRGQTLILAPFYTACRTRCPATIAKLRAIEGAYRGADQPRDKPAAAIVLVTLDPANDTADRLMTFKKNARLPDAWTLLRGNPDDTRALARLVEAHPAGGDGHIDHQVRIVVFDREGRMVRNLHGWDFPTEAAVIH